MKYLVLLFFLYSFTSCNKQEEQKAAPKNIKQDATKLSANTILKLNYIDYAIDGKAKNTLDSWQSYNTIAVAINNIKTLNFNFFTQDNTVFLSTINDLEKTVPPRIKNQPILARILILKTNLFKFEEVINLTTTSKREKLLAIEALFQSFSYLTLQINKKFEKEAQNIIKPELVLN